MRAAFRTCPRGGISLCGFLASCPMARRFTARGNPGRTKPYTVFGGLGFRVVIVFGGSGCLRRCPGGPSEASAQTLEIVHLAHQVVLRDICKPSWFVCAAAGKVYAILFLVVGSMGTKKSRICLGDLVFWVVGYFWGLGIRRQIPISFSI